MMWLKMMMWGFGTLGFLVSALLLWKRQSVFEMLKIPVAISMIGRFDYDKGARIWLQIASLWMPLIIAQAMKPFHVLAPYMISFHSEAI